MKRYVILMLISFFALGALTACEGDEDPQHFQEFTTVERERQSDQVETDLIDHGNALGRKAVGAVGYGIAWFLQLLVIAAAPVLILFIPGKGRPEKLAEGAALIGLGIYMYYLSDETRTAHIQAYAIAVCVIPGALLFLWGIASGADAGKVFLMGGVSILFGIYLFFYIFWLFNIGLVFAPLTVLVIILLKLALIGVVVSKANA